jgi:hypothetical protein
MTVCKMLLEYLRILESAKKDKVHVQIFAFVNTQRFYKCFQTNHFESNVESDHLQG